MLYFSACGIFVFYFPRVEISSYIFRVWSFFPHVEFSSYISMCGNPVWYFPRVEFSCFIFCVWKLHDIFSVCIIVFHVWNFCAIFFCEWNSRVIFPRVEISYYIFCVWNFSLYFLCWIFLKQQNQLITGKKKTLKLLNQHRKTFRTDCFTGSTSLIQW